jgi:pectinesterase
MIQMKMKISLSLLILWVLFATAINAQSPESELKPFIHIVVAQDGTGTVTSVQQAIDRVPDHNQERMVIFIRNGIYREKIHIPSAKTNITLVGENAEKVILDYDDYSGRIVNGDTIGTFTSYSFAVDADDFTAINLTFRNSAGPVGQAVALRTGGDRQAFYHCRLIGHQDTYYSWGYYRNYLKDCFIEGTTDYIFGRSTVVFDNCRMNSLKSGSFITAASTEENMEYGYVFTNCTFTADTLVDRVYLGRPWRPYGKTVIINSYLGGSIHPQGWSIWRGNENHLTAFYAEFNNTGPGAPTIKRAGWSNQLQPDEAAHYTPENIFSVKANPRLTSDWLPQPENDPVYRIVNKHLLK